MTDELAAETLVSEPDAVAELLRRAEAVAQLAQGGGADSGALTLSAITLHDLAADVQVAHNEFLERLKQALLTAPAAPVTMHHWRHCRRNGDSA